MMSPALSVQAASPQPVSLPDVLVAPTHPCRRQSDPAASRGNRMAAGIWKRYAPASRPGLTPQSVLHTAHGGLGPSLRSTSLSSIRTSSARSATFIRSLKLRAARFSAPPSRYRRSIPRSYAWSAPATQPLPNRSVAANDGCSLLHGRLRRTPGRQRLFGHPHHAGHEGAGAVYGRGMVTLSRLGASLRPADEALRGGHLAPLARMRRGHRHRRRGGHRHRYPGRRAGHPDRRARHLHARRHALPADRPCPEAAAGLSRRHAFRRPQAPPPRAAGPRPAIRRLCRAPGHGPTL